MKKIIYTLMLLTLCSRASAQEGTAYGVILQNSSQFQTITNPLQILDYYVYLSQPSFAVIALMPTDDAMRSFVDPASYYNNYSQVPQMWEFNIDTSKRTWEQLSADVYDCTFDDDGNPVQKDAKRTTLTGLSNTSDVMTNRMKYLLDNSIVMGFYKEGNEYYKTLGNSYVRIRKEGGIYKVTSPLYAHEVTATAYEAENGLVLAMDSPIVPNRNSVASVLSQHPEFSEYLWALEYSGALSKLDSKDYWVAGDQDFGNLLNTKQAGYIGAEDATNQKVTYLLNGYHYTIYAPTNAAMAEAFAAGLPDAAAMEKAEQLDIEEDLWGTPASHTDSLKEVLLNFVKYHIHDDALFLDNALEPGAYDSGMTEFVEKTNIDEESGETVPSGTYIAGPSYKLKVRNGSRLEVTDNMGTTAEVVKQDGLYNLVASEYWTEGRSNTIPYTARLNNSSFVVIHAINKPLLYSADQFKYEYKKIYIGN